MKKLLYIIFFSLLPMFAAGQVRNIQEAPSIAPLTEYSGSPVIRKGNFYIIDNWRMDKRAYRGFLKNTCPEAYRQFDRGYKTAMAGWGLFATGPVLVGVGSYYAMGASFGYHPDNTPAQERRRKAVWGCNTGLACLGGASFISGIVCLSVGYHQMHRTTGILNCSTTAYWTIETRPNEIGLALHF